MGTYVSGFFVYAADKTGPAPNNYFTYLYSGNKLPIIILHEKGKTSNTSVA